MPLPIIANCARVTFNLQSSSGAASHNVIHVMKDAGVTYTELGDRLASLLDDAAEADLWRPLPSDYGLTSVDITPLDGTTATRTIERGASAWPDGQGGIAVLPQVCALIKEQTAVRGRRNRGRIYIGPITETSQADGNMVSTTQDALTDAWVAFSNDLVGQSLAIGVASYVGRTVHQVTEIACERSVATQRRRLHRV